jgi:hypothetical protein
MGFVLQRTEDGAFVRPPGEARSYTYALQLARVYPNRDAAERDRCPGNEVIRPVADVLDSRRGDV